MAATRIYNLGFLLSTGVAGLLYYASSRIWPIQPYPQQYADRSRTWEAMRYTEGFFPEDMSTPTYLLDTTVINGEGGSIDKGVDTDNEKMAV